MKRGLLAAGAVWAAIGLSGCAGGHFGRAFHDEVDESRPLAANGRFSLRNTNGRVQVGVWDEARVRIEAHKRATGRRALERIEIAIEGEGEEVSVRTRQGRGPFLFGGGSVDYTVTVPRGAAVSVRNVNGRVEIEGVAGEVLASTTNGSVDASDLGGAVDASTTNGSVDVQLARVDPASRNRLRATNGSVRLVLPPEAAADVEARTVNGSARCEFDLEGGRKSRRQVEGRIGGGGARFELSTVNGSARIERGLTRTAKPASAPPPEAPAAR